VMTAFIFRCITRIRQPRLPPSLTSSSSAATTLARAVDVRRYLNIPAGYPGAVNNMSYLTLSPPQILAPLNMALPHLSLALRTLVDPATSNLGPSTRALVTHLAHTNPMAADVTATLNLDTDIMLSSWAGVKAWNLDFNLGLGKPVCTETRVYTVR
jgi:trichothecene 3-O-acetyltransferase